MDKYLGDWDNVFAYWVEYGKVSSRKFFWNTKLTELITTNDDMKSFRLFWQAVRSTRHEMWVSVQVLVAVTIVLSLLLYLVEHNTQPDVFRNYWDALLWSFMGYINDPGEFATYTPITFWGRVLKIACAIVNIAVFAVPAGLVAGGFSDAIADDKRERELEEFKSRILKSFRRKQCRYTRFRTIPRYVSPVDVQAQQQIDTKDIIDTIRHSDVFRLRNLASAIPSSKNPQDRLVIETIPTEGRTAYGCCIDRGSKITIVAPTATSEVGMGHFAYHLALYGGFNYVSKERDEDSDWPRSYYVIDEEPTEVEKQYLEDIRRLSRGGWVIVAIVADSVHPEEFHFISAISSKLNVGEHTVIDTKAFNDLYNKVSEGMKEEFDLLSERDIRYLPVGKKNLALHVGGGKDCNAFTLRIDWSITAFDERHIAIAHKLASDIASTLEGKTIQTSSEWKKTGFGY